MPRFESRPPSSYYENPYMPTYEERQEWDTLPLLAVEAHSLLINNFDRLSRAQKAALREIADGSDSDPDYREDYFALLKKHKS